MYLLLYDLVHGVGKWVRAQGRIEEDTFVRDLVMMMSDIEEIKKTPKHAPIYLHLRL
jgi:DNA polymerase III alpha subunit (gram-positive type)